MCEGDDVIDGRARGCGRDHASPPPRAHAPSRLPGVDRRAGVARPVGVDHPGRVAAWIYGMAGILLYLTSSSYHVFARSPRARRVMQRADHSMIFVLIAGTFTPVCILALGGPWRWLLLAAMWTAAIGGVILKLVAIDRFPRLGNALYIVLGWAALAALPALIHRPWMLALIAAGGLLYTGGAVLFFLNRPKLSPTWFGYHEVWHAFGVAAGVLLFVVNLGLVRAG